MPTLHAPCLSSMQRAQWSLAFAILAAAPAVHAQGLGDPVTLHTKLPAIVNLAEPDVEIKVIATALGSAQLAATLVPEIQSLLQQGDHRIITTSPHPATRIEVNIITYTPYKVEEVKIGTDTTYKGKTTPAAKGHVVTADLTLAYRAISIKTGRPIDAAVVDARIKENYGIPETKKPCKFCPSLPTLDSWKKVFDTAEPVPNAPAITKRLTDEAASKIAARLVNTNQDIQVRLSKGQLAQEANVARTGNWAKFLDDLKTTPPLSDPAADSYRLYDMGVAYEALGYQAQPGQAAPLFDQASENYKAANDAAPLEKGFLEPLVRVQIAQVTIKTIEERAKNGGRISKEDLAETKSADEKAAPIEKSIQTADAKGIHEDKPSGNPDVLDDAKIIRYTAKGLDDDNLIAMINTSTNYSFKLDGDDLDRLLDAKVSNKVIAAMRAKNASPHSAPARRTATKTSGTHS